MRRRAHTRAATLPAVLTEVATGTDPITNARVFWWRMLDNLFRRLLWYVLPVVAFAAVGVIQAGNTLQLYKTSARLNAAGNPFVPDPARGVATPTGFETVAGALSRVINERIRTDDFTRSVATGAGLPDGTDLENVRESIWASASGASIVTINATWEDPETSYLLAESTIAEASAYLRDNVIRAAAAAESFYQSRVADLQQQREDLLAEYDAFVSGLPALAPGEDHPFSVEIQVGRLQSRLDDIDDRISSAQQDLDDALLSRAQLETEAGESFSVVDPPEPPSKPESTLGDRIALIGSFTMIGLAVAGAALLLTTAIDRTVNAPTELLTIPGVTLVATAGKRSRRSARNEPVEPARSPGR